MHDRTMQAMARGIAPALKRICEAAIAPVMAENARLVQRVVALESRPVAAPRDGVGITGALKDSSGVLILTLSDGNALNTGIRDGEKAQPLSPVDIAPIVAAEVEKAVAALPVAKDGQQGELGPVGPAGKDASPEAIAAAVQAAVAGLVLPKGERGDAGPEGAVGPAGKDGAGLAGAVIDRDGALVLTLTDGSVRSLGVIVGRDGAPGVDGKNGLDGSAGADGKDGLGFDDLEVKHDGGRGFMIRFARNEQVKEFAFALPVVLDRGVYKAGQAYEPGDAVSWGGSLWIAQRQTEDKPETSDAWRLSTKRGRDGKDGKDGKDGIKGADGRPGRDAGSW